MQESARNNRKEDNAKEGKDVTHAYRAITYPGPVSEKIQRIIQKNTDVKISLVATNTIKQKTITHSTENKPDYYSNVTKD